MRALAGRSFAPFLSAILFLGFLLLGCQPVREDRSITWSKKGESVGFQHGKEGVFVADKQGGRLTKIFQPGLEVLATSTPLWSPTGNRVIFTTARDAHEQTRFNLPFWGGEQDPAGNLHTQRDILYTCWLRPEAAGDKTPVPVPLFEAACNHPGYVAANLAVRWHPQGQSLFYVQQVDGSLHGLFEYDLGSKQSRRVFPHAGEALIFDWSPDGSHLVCVLGSHAGQPTDGIWIGQPGREDWWHVPESESLALASVSSLLERLQATRPAWTTDSTRFAFASYTPAPVSDEPGRYHLWQGTLATRTTNVWIAGLKPYRDLQWTKAGDRLGVVIGKEDGSLHLVRPGGGMSPPVNRAPVRRFIGWSSAGDHLAYTVPDPLPFGEGERWAFLLVPDEQARDAVYLADSEGKGPGRVVFSGVRVTFPLWSPREVKLSLWVTFSPAYHSWVSQFLGWQLRPGDPATIFDLKTGRLSWMAVKPQEKVQVGHYYLLKREYAEALRWYTEAERELPAPKPISVRQFAAYLRGMTGPRDFSFFQSYCLMKLRRKAEARAKLDQFRRVFLPDFSKEPADGQPTEEDKQDEQLQGWLQLADPNARARLRELLDPKGMFVSLLQNLYMAEVFLSLDAADDGERFFRDQLAAAASESARLSSVLTLAQILLLEKKYSEYAGLATKTLAPSLYKTLRRLRAGQPRDPLDPQTLLDLVGSLSLVPLCTPEFLTQLPKDRLQAVTPRWVDLRAKMGSERSQREMDLILQALYQQLGQEKECQEVTQRLKNKPASALEWPSLEEIRQQLDTLRKLRQDMLQLR
jgi:hypothetical protein